MSDMPKVCPICHQALPMEGAAFCPFCGAAIAKKDDIPAAAQEALHKAQKTDNPVKKHQLLTEAQKVCPDCLAIERELLHLGRLHQRSTRSFTYEVIKCYLLQIYLTPEEFTSEKRDAMRHELFEHEQLKRCQTLSPDAVAFTRAYLQRLSDEFIQLFLEGSNQYMRRYLGFSFGHNPAKVLAPVAAGILKSMQQDDALTQEQRTMLMNAFYAAYIQRIDSGAQFLQSAMRELDCDLPQ